MRRMALPEPSAISYQLSAEVSPMSPYGCKGCLRTRVDMVGSTCVLTRRCGQTLPRINTYHRNDVVDANCVRHPGNGRTCVSARTLLMVGSRGQVMERSST